MYSAMIFSVTSEISKLIRSLIKDISTAGEKEDPDAESGRNDGRRPMEDKQRTEVCTRP